MFRRASLIHVAHTIELCSDVYGWVMWKGHVTHTTESCADVYEWVMSHMQGGEDSLDAFSCRSFFAKEPLIIKLFCGK